MRLRAPFAAALFLSLSLATVADDKSSTPPAPWPLPWPTPVPSPPSHPCYCGNACCPANQCRCPVDDPDEDCAAVDEPNA